MNQETPCAVCRIDPKTNPCLGCRRTRSEIARWRRMDSAERRPAMAELPQHAADAGVPTIATGPELA
jgi:uncharacterized protein